MDTEGAANGEEWNLLRNLIFIYIYHGQQRNEKDFLATDVGHDNKSINIAAEITQMINCLVWVGVVEYNNLQELNWQGMKKMKSGRREHNNMISREQ